MYREYYHVYSIIIITCIIIFIVLSTNKEQLIQSAPSTFTKNESEGRPKNIYSQEEINLYCVIKLATEIS